MAGSTHTLMHAGVKTSGVIGSTSINIEHNGKPFNTKIHFSTSVKTLYLLLNVRKKFNLMNQNTTKIQIPTSMVLLLQCCYLLHLFSNAV